MTTLTLAEVVALLDRRYPRVRAEEWDAVGLVCGRPGALVTKVLFAVDPVPVVVDEAVTGGFDLVVTHHPLFLHPVHDVAADLWKGRMVHDLIEQGVGLFSAHTNADVAAGGVNDALAATLGLRDVRDLPTPAGDVESATTPSLGRWGRLVQPESLAQFVDRVAVALPATAAGVRVAGDLGATVETVAVCGGAGDSLLEQVQQAGIDVFVTADLRHHVTLESMLGGGPALVDPGHWASEWPWLPVAARRLAEDAAAAGATVGVAVSSLVTDPWSDHRPFDR